MKTLNHALSALALCLAAGSAAAANDVRLSPANATLNPGDTVELTLSGSNFADVMIGGGVSLAWNPDVLDLASVTVDASTWELARNGGQLDPASGTLSGMFFASFAGRSGSFDIATLRFTADGPGSTTVALSDAVGQPFANELAEVVSANYGNASITVSAVPEPGTWALFALGAAGLVVLRRRGA